MTSTDWISKICPDPFIRLQNRLMFLSNRSSLPSCGIMSATHMTITEVHNLKIWKIDHLISHSEIVQKTYVTTDMYLNIHRVITFMVKIALTIPMGAVVERDQSAIYKEPSVVPCSTRICLNPCLCSFLLLRGRKLNCFAYKRPPKYCSHSIFGMQGWRSFPPTPLTCPSCHRLLTGCISIVSEFK